MVVVESSDRNIGSEDAIPSTSTVRGAGLLNKSSNFILCTVHLIRSIENMSSSSIIFLHISKTGGTTLRSIIEKQYPPDKIYDVDASYFTSDSKEYDRVFKERIRMLKEMPDQDKASYECFFHPLAYGLHQILPQSARYVTMLRDPVDHYISNYYFAVNKSGHIHHEYVLENAVRLDNYHEHFHVDNLMTRRLSGCDPLDAFHAAPLPHNAINLAKENLKQVAVVGLMEEFDLSLLMMQQVFKWTDVRYTAKNVAAQRSNLIDLKPETRALLNQLLQDDIELYTYACELFREQKRHFDLEDNQLLEVFQRDNKNYNRWVTIKVKAAKTINALLKGTG